MPTTKYIFRRATRGGLFKPDVVRQFVREHHSGRNDWSMQLWQFPTLKFWMGTFLDCGAQRFEG
jgi:hypothetical protein